MKPEDYEVCFHVVATGLWDWSVRNGEGGILMRGFGCLTKQAAEILAANAIQRHMQGSERVDGLTLLRRTGRTRD